MKTYFLFPCMFFSYIACFSQSRDLQTPCAAAGQGTAGDLKISYTIGEMVLVSTERYSNFLLTQGILQPEEGKIETGGSAGFQPGEVEIFPNPTPDRLSVRIALFNEGNISMELIDATGKQLIRDEFQYSRFVTKEYSLAKYAASLYLLKITYKNGIASNNRTGIYKIIKYN